MIRRIGEYIKEKWFSLLIWSMIGIAISWAGTAMILSHSFNLDRFYDVGDVYDVFESSLKVSMKGMQYNYDDEQMEVTDSVAYQYIDLSQVMKDWNYIYIQVSDMQEQGMNWTVRYIDNDGQVLWAQTAAVHNGYNVFCSENIEYSRIQICINDYQNSSFHIDRMQFRQKELNFSLKKACAVGMLIFLAYCAILFILRVLWQRCSRGKRWNWYVLVDGLQTLFVTVGNTLGELTERCSTRGRSISRTCLWAFMIFYMQIMFVMGRYESDKYYRYCMIVCIFCIFAIAILSIEGTLKKVDWNNRLVASWLTLWVIAIISDIILVKRYCYQGLIMIFVVGFFFLVWGNMKDRRRILSEFWNSVEAVFWVNITFCILCRPYTEGMRYCGVYYNPGMMGMYLLFCIPVFLAKLDRKMRLTSLIALGICGNLLWKTQSTSSISAAILMIVLVFIHGIRKKIRTNISGRTWAVWILVTPIILVASYSVTGWAVSNTAHLLDNEIKFENDVYAYRESNYGLTLEAHAATVEENRFFDKLQSSSLEELTTGRSTYWKGYLRGINLYGHENKERLWGKNRWPHNGFIAIIYRYGIFAGIPYLIMIAYSGLFALRQSRRGNNEGYYMLLLAIGAMALIAVENLELPFAWLSWISYYMMMGYYFTDEHRRTLR